MSLTKQILINYRPHEGQLNFHNSTARFRSLACGRRWGKTIGGANEAVKQAISKHDAVGFCVAPTYWHTQKQLTTFLLYCPKEFIVKINRADRHIELINNSHVWFKSADNPDSLRSEGLDWLWVDEGGQVKEEAWTLALRPALMDKHGIAWFTGTPKGKNWYFMLWTRGQDPEQKDYESWTYGSDKNPYLDKKEIAEFARDMPKLAYEQEILGLFIEDVGSVFRGVESCIQDSLSQPSIVHTYVAGADLAKYEDFTVIVVLDDTGHISAWDRFGDIDWVLQRKRLVHMCKRYNARLLLDSTGLGDPILDELQREEIRVEGYKFSHASKKDLIENLSMMLENHKLTYPNIPELINELKLYQYKITPSGITGYEAPSGYHDDCVIALALAAWQLHKPKGYIII